MLVILFLDLVWIGFLTLRLKKVRTNPHRFDAIPGYENYRNSAWYWPLKKSYRTGDPPDRSTGLAAPLLVCAVMYFFISTAAVYYLPKLQSDDMIQFAGKGAWMLLSYALLGWYSILLAFYIPLFLKTPKAICFSLFHIYPKQPRSTAWEKMTRFVLIATIILLPFRAFSLCNTGYVNSQEIVYRPFWSLREQHFTFDEGCELLAEQKDEETVHWYLVNENGDRFALDGHYTFIDETKGKGRTVFLKKLPDSFSEKIEQIDDEDVQNANRDVSD